MEMEAKLTDWRKRQIDDILQWAEKVPVFPTPKQVKPKTLHEYPEAIERSDKLRRLCKWKEERLTEQIQRIEDQYTEQIEKETFIFKIVKSMPEYRKKYSSAEARQRELRKRLDADEHWSLLERERLDWDEMKADWRAHGDRLRRERDTLMEDYVHNGGTTISLHDSD